ncbi:histidinol-phosphatase [Halomonas aquatica]|uniref:Histidinol-phosphatase n=1 Tax=Halomonas aquatica TaxID=3151123 RepID=A0ABV1NI66_9GAMM
MKPSTEQTESGGLASFACELADLARPMAMEYFRRNIPVEQKADLSPVTHADRSIEASMRALIEKTYPGHGIFGEEHGASHLDSKHVWVLDPIDGTKSFVTGMPIFGTLIALLEDGRPVLGVISIPPTGELWIGRDGQATQFNRVACHTSTCTGLADALAYTTSPDNFDAAGLKVFDRVSSLSAMRRYGGDCYCYGLLASGHIDVVMEMNLQPYDFMALVPVIEGAGGVITDWQGQRLHLGSDGYVVATSTPELHAEVLETIGA